MIMTVQMCGPIQQTVAHCIESFFVTESASTFSPLRLYFSHTSRSLGCLTVTSFPSLDHFGRNCLLQKPGTSHKKCGFGDAQKLNVMFTIEIIRSEIAFTHYRNQLSIFLKFRNSKINFISVWHNHFLRVIMHRLIKVLFTFMENPFEPKR